MMVRFVRKQDANDVCDDFGQVAREELVAFVNDEQSKLFERDDGLVLLVLRRTRQQFEELLRRSDEDAWRVLDERRRVSCQVARWSTERSSDAERASEPDEESLSLSCLVDGRTNNDGLDTLDRLDGGLVRVGDELQCRNGVRLDSLLDGGHLNDAVLGTKDARDGLHLNFGRRAEAVLGDAPEQLGTDSETFPFAAKRRSAMRGRRASVRVSRHARAEQRRHVWHRAGGRAVV